MTDRQPSRQRSTSRTRNSRPTTPLRPSSRSSFRESARASTGPGGDNFPLNAFEPAFAELSDAMADLEANMMHFQLMHESLSRFSESFASFLYGMNMNAFCVDFSEGPVPESFKRAQQQQEQNAEGNIEKAAPGADADGETTFMTTDTTFIDNPSVSSKPTPRSKTPDRGASRGRGRGTTSTTRGVPSTRGRGGTTRGTRGGTASGIARGRPSGLPRGRGVR